MTLGFVQGSYFCRLIFQDLNFNYCHVVIYDIGLSSYNLKVTGNNSTGFQKICSSTTAVQEYAV